MSYFERVLLNGYLCLLKHLNEMEYTSESYFKIIYDILEYNDTLLGIGYSFLNFKLIKDKSLYTIIMMKESKKIFEEKVDVLIYTIH